jgi:hypothetical protein
MMELQKLSFFIELCMVSVRTTFFAEKGVQQFKGFGS